MRTTSGSAAAMAWSNRYSTAERGRTTSNILRWRCRGILPDGSWLEGHLGTDYDSVIQIAQRFTELAGSRVRGLKPPSSFEEFCGQILAAMSFSFLRPVPG